MENEKAVPRSKYTNLSYNNGFIHSIYTSITTQGSNYVVELYFILIGEVKCH